MTGRQALYHICVDKAKIENTALYQYAKSKKRKQGILYLRVGHLRGFAADSSTVIQCERAVRLYKEPERQQADDVSAGTLRRA